MKLLIRQSISDERTIISSLCPNAAIAGSPHDLIGRGYDGGMTIKLAGFDNDPQVWCSFTGAEWAEVLRQAVLPTRR